MEEVQDAFIIEKTPQFNLKLLLWAHYLQQLHI